MRGSIKKFLSKSEYPWLQESISPGTIVHRFRNVTYGVVSPNGIPISFEGEMEYPFFEVPHDAVEWFNEP